MSEDPAEVRIRQKVRWIAVVLVGVIAIVAGVVISLVAISTKEFILEQLTTHIRAIVGLPLAVIIAFFIVSVLDAGSSKPIEFNAIGFEFKGASGPIVLWIACFLAVVCSLWLLW